MKDKILKNSKYGSLGTDNFEAWTASIVHIHKERQRLKENENLKKKFRLFD